MVCAPTTRTPDLSVSSRASIEYRAVSSPKALRSKCGCGGGRRRVEITAQRSAALPHASGEGNAQPVRRGRLTNITAIGAATRETPGTRSIANAQRLPRDVTQSVSPVSRIAGSPFTRAVDPARDVTRYSGRVRCNRPRDRPLFVRVMTR